uniref:Uncharacterized protein n=1 Tax=Cyclophora tenuis TaxID=216820 RepID=A0A7S1GL56_CYCTE|mmetsp:Transcript_21202/g.36181  ORF Transcript_21202/g.36181 Transcript_21202/m.36181 type:complete len:228 (+) Transcript_21202:89-772(+)|eukprot:CAMPEP_0116552146 /NCGR_PEP_ID=MMETSP0397-20121206/6330_1 /TAXON_ID=216820 /ORGANISM="Cyclophora tenuis, Strain ECT3854" /LENGTH=227 /DNA_ID=CAMNT_0004077075 /DNA_START=1 /DNA_END=684 /DNA_ORIENTATION=-
MIASGKALRARTSMLSGNAVRRALTGSGSAAVLPTIQATTTEMRTWVQQHHSSSTPSLRFKSTAAVEPIKATADLMVQNEASPPSPPRRKVVKKGKNLTFVPRKAPVALTEKARTFFRSLLKTNKKPSVAGIILNYHQSSTGEPRMVFSFDFVESTQLSPDDEGVSLEVQDDGSPKPPDQSMDDGLPKLYIHHNAFMKVLGGTLDVDLDKFRPLLFDREGNEMDPNA